jgi:hypothetical protein
VTGVACSSRGALSCNSSSAGSICSSAVMRLTVLYC